MSTDALMVSHSIALRGASAESVIAGLKAHPGVKNIHVGKAGRSFDITYDLRFLRFEDIEQAVDTCGAMPATGIIGTIRRGWRRFTEDNLLTSVSAPVSPCCNRPPGAK